MLVADVGGNIFARIPCRIENNTDVQGTGAAAGGELAGFAVIGKGILRVNGQAAISGGAARCELPGEIIGNEIFDSRPLAGGGVDPVNAHIRILDGPFPALRIIYLEECVAAVIGVIDHDDAGLYAKRGQHMI